MLYGVSLAYKESSNCRLEANYAHQQELDMIPLQMTQGTILSCHLPSFQSFVLHFWCDRFPLHVVVTGYSAKGWLGLILGTRMPGCGVRRHTISTTT